MCLAGLVEAAGSGPASVHLINRWSTMEDVGESLEELRRGPRDGRGIRNARVISDCRRVSRLALNCIVYLCIPVDSVGVEDRERLHMY